MKIITLLGVVAMVALSGRGHAGSKLQAKNQPLGESPQGLDKRIIIRDFRNKFISYGSAPVLVIRRLMLDEFGFHANSGSADFSQ